MKTILTVTNKVSENAVLNRDKTSICVGGKKKILNTPAHLYVLGLFYIAPTYISQSCAEYRHKAPVNTTTLQYIQLQNLMCQIVQQALY